MPRARKPSIITFRDMPATAAATRQRATAIGHVKAIAGETGVAADRMLGRVRAA